MPAPLKLKLNPEELITLNELRRSTQVPQRTKDRAHMLILKAQGRQVADIAAIYGCSEHTVRGAIHRWQKSGLISLWDAPGRGNKAKLTEEDWAYLEQYLHSESKTYSSQQLAEKLAEERQVKVSPSTIRRLLNKKRSSG
jgi:transposase